MRRPGRTQLWRTSYYDHSKRWVAKGGVSKLIPRPALLFRLPHSDSTVEIATGSLSVIEIRSLRNVDSKNGGSGRNVSF